MKIKIGTKIFITYFFLIIITISVTLGSFNLLSQKYLINNTKDQLKLEGLVIANLYKNVPLDDIKIRERFVNNQRIAVASKYVDSNIIIINDDKKLIYTNIDKDEYDNYRSLAILDNKKDYVTVRTPIYNTSNETKGYVILFTKIKGIKDLNNLMIGTQAISLLIAGGMALLVGYLLKRNLTKPIIELMNAMINYRIKKTNYRINFKTGDEIEELANSFSQMIDKLRIYDENQRNFFQNVSHELKTPLMSIQGNAEGIKEGIIEGKKETSDSLEIIIEESQKLKKIVDEIIYLSKLENTEETFNLQLSNLDEIINKSIKNVNSVALKHNIVIQYGNDLNIVALFDNEKLIKALTNILDNSIRYAKDKITIEGSSDIIHATIRIMDDGPGLRNGEENKVFERFYKGKKGQTGIGLSITKAIVEAHKGNIIAYNGIEKGAIFEITLPANNQPIFT
ncbi:MAG: sensor histidine kinase [Vulcanibacillus sp.]